MILSEWTARLFLVLHTVLAVAAIGASTHLVLWLRTAIRSSREKKPRSFIGARKFAAISLVLHLAAFAVGNLMYPTYKLRVRLAFLEDPVLVDSQMTAQRVAVLRLEQPSLDAATAQAMVAATPRNDALRAAKIARWFDIKEHLLVLGLLCAGAAWWITRRWQPDPDRDHPLFADAVWLTALFASLTLWSAGVIGLLTAAWRAI